MLTKPLVRQFWPCGLLVALVNCGAVVTLATPKAASAGVISHVQPVSFAPFNPTTGTGGNLNTLTFPQFDSALGTLTGVTLTFSGTTQGSYSANPPANGLARLESSMFGNPVMTFATYNLIQAFQGLTGGAVTSAADFSSTIEVVQPAGSAGQKLPFQPADGINYWFDNPSPAILSFQSDIYALVGSSAADAYFIGSGSQSLVVQQSMDFGPLEQSFPPVPATFANTSGNATLAYTYTAVPEPSTIVLTGLGALALGAGAIRRSRKGRAESLASGV